MTPFSGRFYGRKTRRVQGRTHDQPQKRKLSSECAQRRRMQDRVLLGPSALRSSDQPRALVSERTFQASRDARGRPPSDRTLPTKAVHCPQLRRMILPRRAPAARPSCLQCSQHDAQR